MPDFDDNNPMDQNPPSDYPAEEIAQELPEESPPPKKKGLHWGFAVVAVLVAVGAGAWYYFTQLAAPPPVDEVVEVAPPAVDASEPAPPALPPLNETDPMVRKVLGGLSANATLLKWLDAKDLVRRFVTGVSAVAKGESPRESFDFMGPVKPFKALEKKKKKPAMDPKSYARYDAIAAVVDSLKAPACVAAYHELSPLLEAAYAEIAPQGSKFESVLIQALDRLIGVAPPPAKIELKLSGAVYKYANAKLEGLSAAEKHLLRMGPKNMKKIQGKLKELRAGVTAPPAEPAKAEPAPTPAPAPAK